MIVCQCTGTSDKKVRRLVREGATTVAEITRRCGAGGCCQSCRPLLNRIVKTTLAEDAAAQAPTLDLVAKPAMA